MYKLSDDEIIKALEQCPEKLSVMDCKKCPLNDLGCARYALDLINRLKAEIESLKDTLNATIAGQETLQQYITTAKSEARKEFAEFLKARKIIADTSNYYGKECITEVITVEDIDTLLKEMG